MSQCLIILPILIFDWIQCFGLRVLVMVALFHLALTSCQTVVLMFDVFVEHCGILAWSPGAFLEADKLVLPFCKCLFIAYMCLVSMCSH